jgi:hypothetical protein
MNMNEFGQEVGAIDRELGWEESIQKDSPEFVLLPEGDYDFEVIKFERGRHPGSDKLPACNKATVSIKVEGPEGVAIIEHKLFLHTKTEGLLCSFFTGIGQRQHGEKINMNWNKVVGSKGRCKIGQRSYTNDAGKTLQFNDIKKFYDPKELQAPKFEQGRF